jgi:hypothetical protein
VGTYTRVANGEVAETADELTEVSERLTKPRPVAVARIETERIWDESEEREDEGMSERKFTGAFVAFVVVESEVQRLPSKTV